MDPTRFDALARSLAGDQTRRSILQRLLGAAAAAVALAARPVAAKPNPTRCLGTGRECTSDSKCCSGLCTDKQRGRGTCAACRSGIVCGDICCPADALNGCTEINGPTGPVIGCLCPCGTTYDHSKNVCRATRFCEGNGDCCSDTCCNGTCCNDGEMCCGGKCRKPEDCVCPTGTGCSGDASCKRCDRVYTPSEQCCEYPYVEYCCSDSAANSGDGSAGCCIPGVNCPQCPAGSGSGVAGRANVPECLERGGSFEECCARSTPGGQALLEVPCASA
jgi:hypothetical protein